MIKKIFGGVESTSKTPYRSLGRFSFTRNIPSHSQIINIAKFIWDIYACERYIIDHVIGFDTSVFRFNIGRFLASGCIFYIFNQY